MNKIILNTTFIIPDARVEEFIRWGHDVYINALTESRIFSSPQMARILHRVEPGATSIAIQAQAISLEAATRWHDETAALLRDDLAARFPQGELLHFTTYMELL